MVDFAGMTSGITQSFMAWGTSAVFWTVAGIILVTIFLFFYGSMKRKGKLKYNVLELVRFGNGKVGINRMRAGIFKKKSMFFGLLDYGSESVFKTEDGRRIQEARTSHLHDIFGKKGFIVMRKSDDPKILVPISKVQIGNLEALMDIAPADYREASVNIIQDTIKETTGTWEKILPYVAIGIIVILCIITVIINQQMTNNTVNKVGELLIQGCKNELNVQGGASP